MNIKQCVKVVAKNCPETIFQQLTILLEYQLENAKRRNRWAIKNDIHMMC